MFSASAFSSNCQRGDEEVRYSDLVSECGHGGDSVTPPGFLLSSGYVTDYSIEQKGFIVFACSLDFLHTPKGPT